MMAVMGQLGVGQLAAGWFHRPDRTTLLVAIAATLIGWAMHVWAERSTRPPRVEPGPAKRPPPLPDGSTEPPAVVALLTNGFRTPHSAATATAINLAARGWVRLATVDSEPVVVTRSQAAAGDTLQPFEQQVLNHLHSRAFNDVVSAGTIAASHHRLDADWWRRFERAVADTSRAAGLSRPRYTPVEFAPPAAAVAIGLIAAWMSGRSGEQIAIADSWTSRTVWLLTILSLVALGWATAQRVRGTAQRPTDAGLERAALWMGFRKRLRDRIPAHASALAPPPQQQALAQACVMGVAEHVLAELPVAPEEHRYAWSEAGNAPHVVRVYYPSRPGYGQHPARIGVAGVIVLLLGRWLQGFLRRVADGESLTSLLDRAPGQVDVIETIAEVLALLCWLPIAWGAWAVVSGIVDSLATRERVGAIVRARRPGDVLHPLILSTLKPLAERDRFSTYLAVDDGRRDWVIAWLANERTAAPQGAQARVRATPLLGFIRSSEPIGTATRAPSPTP